MATSNSKSRRKLIKSVVCPHCWNEFAPEDALWISEAPALLGDYKLGETERVRFLPTEYDARGAAVDAKGYSCKDLACPRCHLKLPACALDSPALFMSIVGAPASGKSYYLASSTFMLRSSLASKFRLNFLDGDPEMNAKLSSYETMQFVANSSELVKIEKTQEFGGDLYNTVLIGDQSVTFPQPFVFLAAPGAGHPNEGKEDVASRMICLYDNAGESYLPTKGADLASNPVTRHLAQCKCLFFLYDPTQDPRFRKACREVSKDPQVYDDSGMRVSTLRQDSVFAETAKRVRAHNNIPSYQKFDRPLVVIVSKADVWRRLVPSLDLNVEPVAPFKYRDFNVCALRNDVVRHASQLTRNMLMKYAPEFISSVESFASDVVYIPVSATGVSPVVDQNDAEKSGGFRASEIRPIWIDVPMIYAISRLTKGLIVTVDKDGKA